VRYGSDTGFKSAGDYLQTVTAAHPARPPQMNVSPRLSLAGEMAGVEGAIGIACTAILSDMIVEMLKWWVYGEDDGMVIVSQVVLEIIVEPAVQPE
jgi:hypothetical protein